MTEDISAELADGSEYETDDRKPDMPDKFAESDLQYLVVVGERRGKETLKLRPVTNGASRLAGSVDKNVANGVHRDDRVKGGKGGEVYELLVPAHMDGVEAGDRYTIEEVLGVDDNTPEARDTDFETTESAVTERDTDDTQLVADGGTALTEPLTDSAISERLYQHDDPGHEAGNSVEDVYEAFADLQSELGAHVDDYDEYHEIVHEDRTLIVYDLGADKADLSIALDEIGVDDEPLRLVISSLMHDLAEHTGPARWRDSYPLVVVKDACTRDAERRTRRRLGALTQQQGGAARALDYWATKVQGLTFEQWSSESGRSTGAIGNSISRARKEQL